MGVALSWRSQILAASLVACASAGAAPAADCRLDASDYVTAARATRPPRANGLWAAVQGALRNGDAVSYVKDDPVVVADVQIIRTTQQVVPTADLTLQRDQLFGRKFRMPARRGIEASQELPFPDGRVFWILPMSADHAVVVDATTAELCNTVIAYNVPHPYLVPGLVQEPTEASLQSRVREVVADRAGVRIIFTGVSAGQLTFQENWVSGANIRSSISHVVDQFAKTVRVGPFEFEVVGVSDGRVTLRYNVPSRVSVQSADMQKAGLSVGTPPGPQIRLIR